MNRDIYDELFDEIQRACRENGVDYYAFMERIEESMMLERMWKLWSIGEDDYENRTLE